VLAAHVTKSTKPITTVSKPAPAKANTWRLQLGSFSSQQNSDRLVAKLKQAGFDATTQTKTTKQGGVVHLVFIGPTGDRKHAEAIQHHLKVALHLPSFIVH
jgi:cell division septation protein DedD